MNNIVNFMFGSLNNYNAITSKDNDTLYFVDGVIYKGAIPYSEKVDFVSTLPSTPSQGRIYVLPDYTSKIYNGTEFVTLNVGIVGTISDTTDNDEKVITQAAVKAYITKKLADFGNAEDVTSQIDAAKAEAISTAGTNTDLKIATAKQELQSEINNKIASVFRFKGSKDTYDDVEALTDMVVGDVWHVTTDGKEYVYTGIEWEPLGFTIDLSSYATTDAVSAAIDAKADEIIAEINAYTKTETDAKIKTVSDALADHTSDTDIHVTVAQKTSWDAKATTEQVTAAKEAAIATAAADATTKANNALNDAKTYADGLDDAMDARVSVVENALQWQTIA